MTAARIRVGIVGTTPLRGWAKTAHIPALCALDEYEITAVAASREESARDIAAELGIGHALTDRGAWPAARRGPGRGHRRGARPRRARAGGAGRGQERRD
jgi:hypothetical protein